MGRRGAIGRLRERLVLGPVRAALDPDERVVAWGHVQTPQDGGHGILALTRARCVVHWIARDQNDVVIPWNDVRAWDVQDNGGGPVLSVKAGLNEVAVRLPATSKARVRRASALLGLVGEFAPAAARAPEGFADGGAFAVRPERRGVRGHTRRVVVTVVGVLLILLGLLFASPFLPGPGALTLLAGLAVLASEYDWAREIHQWLKRRLERFWERRRERRRRRRATRDAEAQDA
jgi:uncharacterized protein (TIGR02611 family)